MMQSQNQIKKPITHRCQNHHVHPHNKTMEHHWCKKCKGYVQLVADSKCYCCGYKVSFKDHQSIRQEQRVLNGFVSAFEPMINWWRENSYRFNQDVQTMLQHKSGSWVYQIDIKWIVKYIEMADIDNWNNPEDLKLYKGKVPTKILNYKKIQATIDLIKPHLHKVDFEISWGRSKISHID